MSFEAIRLQSWYGSPQGQGVTRVIGSTLEGWLAARTVESTLGIGYPHPYLAGMKRWSRVLVGASPAEMGVAPWPGRGRNRIALVRPDALPFESEAFERVVMCHLLEGVHSPRAALREVWRLLVPGGRVILMVPNRGGLWARSDASPLGWGRPFSPGQLTELLQESLFIPRQMRYALFLPVFFGNRWVGSADAWEKAGQRWFAPLGGVVLCEAEKVVYAVTPLRALAERAGARENLALPAVENSGPRMVPRRGER